MKWLEVIELRSVESNRELLESQLQALMDDVDKEASKQTIKAYRRVMIETDVSFHLVHDSHHVEQNGSPLGLRLASSLKEFGLVNHRVWMEMQNT
jgi:chlorite dismutase